MPTKDEWLRTQAMVITRPVAVELARLNLHPNTLTLIGFALNVVAAVIVGLGRVRLGAVMMLVASSTDALDGMLARLTSQQSRFGAFLDSVLDRLSEGAVLIGLLAWYLGHQMMVGAYLVPVFLLGSVMVSYTRARAEGVGYECKVGLLTRPVRVVLLGFGMLTGWLTPVLAVLVALTWYTVGQRMLHVYRASRRQP